MLLAEFEYVRPSSLEEAVGFLSDIREARPLAGGQSLINVLKHRIVRVGRLVDLNGIAALRGIQVHGDGSVTIGAMTTYQSLADSEDLRRAQPLLVEVARHLADVQVRSRGTLGGNVCFNDPTSNFPPVMVALDASMTVVGKDRRETVPASAFFRDIYRTAVGPGEILASVQIPARPSGTGAAYRSLRVAPEGWGIVNAVASITLDGGAVRQAHVVLGAVGGAPVRLSGLEAALAGTRVTRAELGRLARQATQGLEPPTDVHASSAYRREMAAVFAARAVAEAIRNAGGEVA